MKSKHPALWLVMSSLSFFALAASSPQCARTSETPLAPSLGAQASDGSCSQGCIETFQAAKKAEQTRFKAAMDACNGDPVCRDAESVAHDAIVTELAADKDACITDCNHQQGTGTGGQ